MLAMPATHALIELLGEAALLLWGVHMVQSGVLRAFGGDLRRLLSRALRHRLAACAAGTGITLALQSSTATALMATSFLASGAIGLVPALGVMLGANIGSALVVWTLAFDLTAVFPVLIGAGVATFRLAAGPRSRNVGRAAIGLGLVLLALHLLVDTMTPASLTPQVREMAAAVMREPLPVLLVAALLAWAMHSSVAAVLVVAALSGAGVVGAPAALAMVLGANLGSALNPLMAAAAGGRTALRLPVANLANRLLGCLLVLPFLPEVAAHLARIEGDPGRLVAAFHLAYNAALALAFMAPLRTLARLLEKVLPERAGPDDPARLRYLDPASLGTPAVALASAACEVLRMADVIEAMLQGSCALLHRDDRRLVAELRRMDDVLAKLHAGLARFLGELSRGDLADGERGRLAQILTAARNLEHAGDAVARGLLGLAARRIRRRLRFADEERVEAEMMHAHLLAQLRLAVAVFVGEDVGAALRLVEEKERFRVLERAATEEGFARLRDGRPRSATSGLHLGIVRELKRVEAHLAAIAHPLLERRNLLRPSRLVRLPRPEGAGAV